MSEHTSETFADFLKGVGRGEINEEATELLHQLIKEVERIAATSGGKPKGKIVITLQAQSDRGMIDISTDVKATMPSKVRAREVMYATRDGRLTKHDPRQTQLALGAKDVLDIKKRQAGDVQ